MKHHMYAENLFAYGYADDFTRNTARRVDACIGGECIGTPIDGCNGGVNDGGDTPIITINLCGTNAALSMMLTFVALGLIGLHRRRSL